MSAINGFSSPFAVSGELGVGTASILGADATANPNAATLLAAGSPQTGPLAAIAQSLNQAATPTVAALETGALTTNQHKILQALFSGNAIPKGTPYSLPWTASGNEPSVVAQVRSYGWIKLIKPTTAPNSTRVVSATYELTPIGQAIARRTNADGVTASGINLSV
jgi:hypothetical protein